MLFKRVLTDVSAVHSSEYKTIYRVKKIVKLAHMLDCIVARMLHVIARTWHMSKQTVSNL